MKILRFAAIVAVLIGSSSFNAVAQSSFGKVVQAKFGVAGGLNWSGLREATVGGVTVDYGSQQGWHAGAFVDIGFLFIGVRPGVYYTNAGQLFTDELLEKLPIDNPSAGLTNFDFTYISVPVDAKIGIPLPVLMPYLVIGPEFKFSTVSDSNGELASQLESTVVAGNVGLGVAVTLGRVRLYPELRAVFGLTSILPETITISGEQIPVESHVENSFVARLGIGI